jgi:hypothetical protein
MLFSRQNAGMGYMETERRMPRQRIIDRPVTQPELTPAPAPSPEIVPTPVYSPTIPPDRQRGGRSDRLNKGQRAKPTFAQKVGRSFPGQGVPFTGDFPGKGRALGVKEMFERKVGKSWNWSAEAARERGKAVKAARKGAAAPPTPRNTAEAVGQAAAITEDARGGQNAYAAYGDGMTGMAGFFSEFWGTIKANAGDLIKSFGQGGGAGAGPQIIIAPAPAAPPAPGYTPAPYPSPMDQPMVKWGLGIAAALLGLLAIKRFAR